MMKRLFDFKSISPAPAGFFIFTVAILAASGCTFDLQKVASKPVIQVNEHVLPAKDFADQLARKMKNFDALGAKDINNLMRAKEDILRTFILESLVQDWSKQNSITVTDTELDKEVNRLRASYPDDLSFRRSLAQDNLSFSDWREQLRNVLLQKAFFASINAKIPTPSQKEIDDYYTQNKSTFKRRERVLLRQIVVDDESKAELLKTELRTKSFEELAKKYSVAPEAKNGGLIGWVERGSVDIFDKAFQMGVGAVSQVLESSYGFHLFKVEQKSPEGYAGPEEVKGIIVSALVGRKEQAEFTLWLDKQIRSSRVLKDSDLINAIHVETRTK